MIYQGALFQFQ